MLSDIVTTRTQDDPGATTQEGPGGSIRSWSSGAADWIARRKWPISVIILYAATMILPAMDRFFTWDEAVFWSQSGGLDGTPAQPLKLVASRELGSPLLIRLLRYVESDLAEVRFLWASLAFLLLVFGAWRLARHIGDRGALFALWVYGTHWLVIAWTPTFYSNVLAAGFALLAATFYLDVIDEERRGRASSMWFGLAMAAMFAMRPLETLLVAAGLAIHFFILNWRKVGQLLGHVFVSIATALVAVGIPWVIDTINRFGSIANRIREGLSQGGQVASGLRSNVIEYVGILSGDRLNDAVPYWSRYVVIAVALIAVGVIVVALVRQGLSSVRGSAGLFILLSFTSASFFLFWREALHERYFFVTMIFAAALFGWALNTLLGKPTGWATRSIVAVVAVIWLVTQVISVSTYEETRDVSSERSARVAAAIRILSDDAQCEVISRYASPVMHVATGCRASLYSDWSDAEAFARDNTEGIPHFIYGPGSDGHFEGLPAGWTVVPAGGYRLAYWIPDHDGGSE